MKALEAEGAADFQVTDYLNYVKKQSKGVVDKIAENSMATGSRDTLHELSNTNSSIKLAVDDLDQFAEVTGGNKARRVTFQKSFSNIYQKNLERKAVGRTYQYPKDVLMRMELEKRFLEEDKANILFEKMQPKVMQEETPEKMKFQIEKEEKA